MTEHDESASGTVESTTPTLSNWPMILRELVAGHDLSAQDAAWAMDQVMTGAATPAQVGAFLLGLQAKGARLGEVSAIADVLLEHARPVPVPGVTLDVVGTGGDGAETVNFSTMAAIVAAACGATVVKHGNRAASSRTGTADVLEELGLALNLEPDAIVSCADELGIAFAFAQVLHPAMRHAAPLRRELGVPTVFNILGPLINPARPRAGLIGCAQREMAPVMAAVFAERGDRVLVVRGENGWDEISPYGRTSVWDTTSGEVVEASLEADGFGLSGIAADALAGGSPTENAEVCRATFGLPRDHPDLPLPCDVDVVRDVVVVNAAAALSTYAAAQAAAAGSFPPPGSLMARIEAHLPEAHAAVESGAAGQLLRRWIDTSQALRPN